jgi:regulatory protein
MRSARPIAPPDEASLHQAALAYLARYSATEAGLRRVLDRRVDRWARTLDVDEAGPAREAARAAVRAVVARLAAAGAVDNAAFAAARVHRLTRAGRSRRAVAAHLAAKGVDAETVRAAVAADDGSEIAAAVALASRRRIGPFRAAPVDEAAYRRELAVLARAGFPRDVAVRVLHMEQVEAEAMLRALRQG